MNELGNGPDGTIEITESQQPDFTVIDNVANYFEPGLTLLRIIKRIPRELHERSCLLERLRTQFRTGSKFREHNKRGGCRSAVDCTGGRRGQVSYRSFPCLGEFRAHDGPIRIMPDNLNGLVLQRNRARDGNKLATLRPHQAEFVGKKPPTRQHQCGGQRAFAAPRLGRKNERNLTDFYLLLKRK